MSVDVKVEDHSGEVLAALKAATEKALTEVGMFVEGQAKLEIESDPRRVDTGNLRNSITNAVDTGDETVSIGTNVEYGIYVHEGTRRLKPANRFLRNAVQNNAGQIKSIIKSILEGG